MPAMPLISLRCIDFLTSFQHQITNLFNIGLINWQISSNSPSKNHQNAIGDTEKLFQISRNQKNGAFSLAHFKNGLMYIFNRANIQSSCGLI